jgi:hypothetical protein
MRGARGLIAGLVVLMFAAIVPASAQDAAGEEQSWLLVIQGEVTAISESEMTLAAGQRALAFTDRPSRMVNFVDIAGLVSVAWAPDGDFTADPPNAALVDEDDGQIGVVEIAGATWQDGLLTLTFTLLEGDAPVAGDYLALTIDDTLAVNQEFQISLY